MAAAAGDADALAAGLLEREVALAEVALLLVLGIMSLTRARARTAQRGRVNLEQLEER